MSRRVQDSSLDESSEFAAFSGAEPIAPPPVIHERLRGIVARDVNPGLLRVGSRIAALHLVAAAASLAVCPQFGIGPFGGHAGLMAFLMDWGWVACAAGCGAAFMTGTGLLSAVLLSPDEKRVLARHSGWIFTSLAAASWAVFMLATGTSADLSVHSAGHHSMLPSSPQAFSAAWNAVWAATAALSALAAYQLAKRYKRYPVPFGGSARQF